MFLAADQEYFPNIQEDEDKSVEGDRDNAGKEDAIVDVVTPADIPAFYSRQVLLTMMC